MGLSVHIEFYLVRANLRTSREQRDWLAVFALAIRTLRCDPRLLTSVACAGCVVEGGMHTLATAVQIHRRPLGLDRLRAVVLLGGSTRPGGLAAAVRRSTLDLPVDDTRSVFHCWQEQIAKLADFLGLETLPLRVLLDHASPHPTVTIARPEIAVSIERDPGELRGTAGVLRDILQPSGYAEDEFLLVANAAQLLLQPLARLFEQLVDGGGDVNIVGHRDGTPSGLMLIRCGALNAVPSVGYIDLKEQALPRIARRHEVRVTVHDRPTGLPLRTAGDYVRSLQIYHASKSGVAPCRTGESWLPTFSIVEPGARVDPDAVVHDSVVLSGGIVDAGASVVRSVVCSDSRVGRNRVCLDQLLPEPRVQRGNR